VAKAADKAEGAETEVLVAMVETVAMVHRD
jgi:hypothetical protein